METCLNCSAPIFCKSRCRACYRYWRRTGAERPPAPVRPAQCSNCGSPRSERRIVKGRCHLCYRHWLRYGTERSQSQKEAYSPICLNCNTRPTYLSNRCRVCYFYLRRTRSERPALLRKDTPALAHRCANENCTKIVRYATRCDACRKFRKRNGRERTEIECKRISYSSARVKPRKCKICGDNRIVSRGRCNACQMYHKRNGKDRPRWMWDRAAGCLTCGVPLSTVLPQHKRSGRCIPCYRYIKRYGAERPRSVWDIGTYGWCGCGRRADHQVSGKPLCTLCKDKEIL